MSITKKQILITLTLVFTIMAGIAVVAVTEPAPEQQVITVVPSLTTTTTTEAPPTTTTTEAPPETIPPPPPVTVPPTTTPPPVQEAPVAPVEVIAYDAGSLEGMICAAFGDQCSKALSVVQCESNFNPGVVGGAGERGLFQIHPVHVPNLGSYGGWDAMFDPASNIAYAHALWSGSGWGPWTCA